LALGRAGLALISAGSLVLGDEMRSADLHTHVAGAGLHPGLCPRRPHGALCPHHPPPALRACQPCIRVRSGPTGDKQV